jgi:hypothetical protein
VECASPKAPHTQQQQQQQQSLQHPPPPPSPRPLTPHSRLHGSQAGPTKLHAQQDLQVVNQPVHAVASAAGHGTCPQQQQHGAQALSLDHQKADSQQVPKRPLASRVGLLAALPPPAAAASRTRLLLPSEVRLPHFEYTPSRHLPKEPQQEVQEAALLVLFMTCAQSWIDDPSPKQAEAMQLVIPIELLQGVGWLAALECKSGLSSGMLLKQREGRVFVQCDHAGRPCRAGSCVRLTGGYHKAILQHKFLREHRAWLIQELEQDLWWRSSSNMRHLQLHVYEYMLSQQELMLYQRVR